jgi:hypothetical protein
MAELNFFQIIGISIGSVVAACILGVILFNWYEYCLLNVDYVGCQLNENSNQSRKSGVIQADLDV